MDAEFGRITRIALDFERSQNRERTRGKRRIGGKYQTVSTLRPNNFYPNPYVWSKNILIYNCVGGAGAPLLLLF